MAVVVTAAASSLRPVLFFLSPPPPSFSVSRSPNPILCGPRDNRGPLRRGRVLSIEAIQAIQALKRADRSDDPAALPALLSKTAARLIKADLVAAVNELLRQDRCRLASAVLDAAAASEPWCRADLALHAKLVTALGRNGMGDEIDRLICHLEAEGPIPCDDRGVARLLRAVITARRAESTVRIYEMMGRSGWGSTWIGDEGVVRVLYGGLKRFGMEDMARKVKLEYETLSNIKSMV